jgi:DNA replication protein DnaC
LIRELAELGFLARAENLALIGPPGTGKSHLAIAIGIRACGAHKRVLFRSVAELLDELIAATVDHTLGARLATLGRVDLLILDELGYLRWIRVARISSFSSSADSMSTAPSSLPVTNLSRSGVPSSAGTT